MQKCHSAVRSSQMLSIVCTTLLLIACAAGDDDSGLAAADSGAPISNDTTQVMADAAGTPAMGKSATLLAANGADKTTAEKPSTDKPAGVPPNRRATTSRPAASSTTAPTTAPARGPIAAASAGSAIVAASAAGLSVIDPKFKRLYGPGVYVIDALADLSIGTVKGFQYIVSHRFRATASGKPTALQVYWPSGSGYAAGNGGKISIRIVPDDGSSEHLPNLSAAPLATGTYEPGLIFGRHVLSSYNDVVRLGSLTPLTSGQLYHVVYENIAADPAGNYIGINNMVTVEKNGRPARWLDPTDWSSLFGYRTVNTSAAFTWKDAGRHPNSGLYYAPILQLNLDSGALIGAIDIEAGNVEGSRQWSIDSTKPIRERFTPTATRLVSGFSVSTAAATAGDLEWSIRQGELVLFSGVISEATANYASQFNTNLTQGVFKWYDIALPSTLTMQNGASYDLVFTPKGASQWRFADEYSGADKGYAAAFSQSQAQVQVSGSWLNANHRSQTSQGPASNWRVVLHLAP